MWKKGGRSKFSGGGKNCGGMFRVGGGGGGGTSGPPTLASRPSNPPGEMCFFCNNLKSCTFDDVTVHGFDCIVAELPAERLLLGIVTLLLLRLLPELLPPPRLFVPVPLVSV